MEDIDAKRPVSVRLTWYARLKLAELAKAYGISKTDILELLIRDRADDFVTRFAPNPLPWKLKSRKKPK